MSFYIDFLQIYNDEKISTIKEVEAFFNEQT